MVDRPGRTVTRRWLRAVAWLLLAACPGGLAAQVIQPFELVPVPGSGRGDGAGALDAATSNVTGAARNLSAARGAARGGAAALAAKAQAARRAARGASAMRRIRRLSRAVKAFGAAGATRSGGAPQPRAAGASPLEQLAPTTAGDAERRQAPRPTRAGGADPVEAVQRKLGLSDGEVRRLGRSLKSSPMVQELRMPFAPSNILFAVGATAGMGIASQLADAEQDVDLGRAVSFLGDGNFWAGLVGSGAGYSLATVVAMSLVPGGAGLLPVVLPLFAGMTGSIVGWELGSGALQDGGLRGALAGLSPARVLGQAAGTSAGLLLGANVGAMLGGTLGAMAGPVGAIAGALVLGNMGARLGESLRGLFTGDTATMDSAFRDVGKTLDRFQALEDAVAGGVPASLPSANLTAEGFAGRLSDEYARSYHELQQALIHDDRALAHQRLQYMNQLQQAYEAEVGGSLRQLAASRGLR